jgi:hypothetical protein
LLSILAGTVLVVGDEISPSGRDDKEEVGRDEKEEVGRDDKEEANLSLQPPVIATACNFDCLSFRPKGEISKGEISKKETPCRQ